jgi:HD-GYP domain-containing protein (c-di-GMP phosphodiesterase class II)
MFRSHPAKGKRIIEPIPFMRDIVPGCYCHHQAWDGPGYPQGLMADNNIPVIGRIVAVFGRGQEIVGPQGVPGRSRPAGVPR